MRSPTSQRWVMVVKRREIQTIRSHYDGHLATLFSLANRPCCPSSGQAVNVLGKQNNKQSAHFLSPSTFAIMSRSSQTTRREISVVIRVEVYGMRQGGATYAGLSRYYSPGLLTRIMLVVPST